VDEDGVIRIGPIPAGTPINLLANLNVDRNDPRFSIRQLLKLLNDTKVRLNRIQNEKLGPAESTALLRELAPALLDASTCPDFEADRGHNFGARLPDADKDALIDFVKTL
jgi:hypothetical protein